MFCVIVVQMKRMTSQSQAFAYCFLRPPSVARRSSRCPPSSSPPPRIRPNRDPDLVLVLNDLGWIVFVAPGRHGARPEPDVGVGDLLRQRAQPVYPRWVAHFAAGRRPRDGPCGLLGDGHLRPLRLEWRRSRSGCATSPSGTFVVVMLVVTWKAVHRQAVDEGLMRVSVSATIPGGRS